MYLHIMKKKTGKLKIFAFILLILETAALAVFAIFYFFNLYQFKTLASPQYVTIGATSLIAINIMVMFVLLASITKSRYRTDLKAAEVIGEDVQEAYNYAMIGLAITDDNDTIIWTNDLFTERHVDVIDKNIIEWQPVLLDLKKEKNNGEITRNVQINNRVYKVKFLAEAGLWIFKDVTEYENVCLHNKNQAPVVGILSIDNYDEVIRGEEDYNDTITRVKSLIFQYAKQFDVLLRRIKESDYLMFCTYESYERMKADDFSIIKSVRKASIGEAIPLTLSIGLARDFPDFNKLNELAASALSMAMSRGGDQVVVSVYGSDMEFYGGRTEAQAKQSRVQTRVFADSLLTLIKSNSNILIMGHKYMDMDALGSCLGIKAMCDYAKANAKLVVDFKLTESKTRAALTSQFTKDELDKLIVSPKEALSIANPSDTLIIVVDVHVPNMIMAPNLLDKGKIAIIDHHRRSEECIEEHVVASLIDPSASSACEIIAEFVKFCSATPKIVIPPTYATIMLSGIFLDSEFYKSSSTGIRTFEASTILKEFGANNSLADDLLKDEFEEFKEVHKIVENLKTAEYGVVYAIGDPNRRFDNATISKAANECMQLKGNHAAFVFARTSDREIKLSARSDGSINVQILCEKMGGGGHHHMAAVDFLKSDVEEVEKILLDTIKQYLPSARVIGKDEN